MRGFEINLPQLAHIAISAISVQLVKVNEPGRNLKNHDDVVNPKYASLILNATVVAADISD